MTLDMGSSQKVVFFLPPPHLKDLKEEKGFVRREPVYFIPHFAQSTCESSNCKHFRQSRERGNKSHSYHG